MSLADIISLQLDNANSIVDEQNDEYVNFVVNHIASRLEEDVRIGLINGKLGILSYVVPNLLPGLCPRYAARLIGDLLMEEFDIELNVSYNDKNKISVKISPEYTR